jgi:hypothetical protein
MTTIIKPKADNGSTYILKVDFTDADGTAVTPNTVVWSLTDVNGNIINGRDDVELTPDTTVYIVMSGDDLLLEDGDERRCTVDAVYNSTTYGNNLPLVEQAIFEIDERFVEEV